MKERAKQILREIESQQRFWFLVARMELKE